MNLLALTDVLLAATLVALAIYALAARTRTESVIVFMLFGLLMAVAWVRVAAPDLALTEASIGSGITGAMLLGALRRLHRYGTPARSAEPLPLRLFSAAGCAGLAVLLTIVIHRAWDAPAGLTDAVYRNLEQSGVANPVTAVILNFRGYDTLIEIGVLLVAVLGVYALCGPPEPLPRHTGAGPVLALFVRWLHPMAVLTAVYIVWVGYKDAGGAFQAGALLGGLGIVRLLAGLRLPLDPSRPAVRAVLSAGFLVFAVAAVLLLARGALLFYPPAQAKHWILAIELACAAGIVATLTALFAGCASLVGAETEDGA